MNKLYLLFYFILINLTIIFAQTGPECFATYNALPTTSINSTFNNLIKNDFNNDGIIDLAMTTSSNVKLIFGNGNGTFPTVKNYSVSANPISMSYGDVNNDGNTDLVTANNNNITVLLVNGTGSVTSIVNYTTNISPISISIGDFNNDGNNDVSLVSDASDYIYILLGTGTGAFNTLTSYYCGNFSQSTITNSDLNNDGNIDILVGYGQNVGSGGVLVFLGNGTGVYNSYSNLSLGGKVSSITVVDINLDGKKDIICSVYVGSSSAGKISVLIGNGDATFQTADYLLPIGCNPVKTTIDDFNGDGLIDIAVILFLQETFAVLFQKPNHAFFLSDFYFAQNLNEIISYDINSDGNKDILVGNSSDNTIRTCLGIGNGTFNNTLKYLLSTSTIGGSSIVSCDFNNDGKKDIATIENSNKVQVLISNSIGTFFQNVTYTVTSGQPKTVSSADFNNDGQTDLVIGGNFPSSINVLTGSNNGTFTNTYNYTLVDNSIDPYELISVDINGDNKLDIVFKSSQYNAKIGVMLGLGNGTFLPETSYLLSEYPREFAGGDFNNDGYDDIAILNGTSANFYIMYGNSTGGLTAGNSYGIGDVTRYIKSFDFNQDGYLDIAVTNDLNLYIFLGTTNGFLAPSAYNTGSSENAFTINDFNNDGKFDIAIYNYGNNNIGFLYGNGNGTFNYVGNNKLSNSNVFLNLISDDFNGDGKVDLGISGNGPMYVYYNHKPNVSILAPNQICFGSSLSLIASGASTYSWSTGNTSTSIAISPTVTTTYTLTGTSIDGCANSTIKTISVSPLPSISINNDTICASNSYTFYPIGANTYTYSNGSNIVTPNITSDYTITGTDANGCIGSTTMQIFVNQNPTILISGVSQICDGSQVSLTCNGANTYTWSTGELSSNIFLTPTATSVYTVTGKDLNNCISSATTQVVVYQNPTINIANIAVCEGQSYTLTPLGASTYTYSSGSDVITPETTSNYTITVEDANGCVSSATMQAIVNPNPTIMVVSSSVCVGTSASLIASGASTFAWSTGATTNSIVITPTVTETYTVTGTDLNNCSNTQTVNIVVDNTCQDIWPGDANSDGTADNLDVLELGLHYTQTGTPRTTTDNSWQSFHAGNWVGTISNGKNLNHSDCNGDGTINDNDTLAIYNNYGLTHTFKTAQTKTVNPQLSIVPDQASVVKGNWGTASIYLGDATTNINTINGVAFTVDFDNTLIEPSNIWIEYLPSFIDASQNLHFRKLDFANSKLFTASTHTVNNNVNGFGKIATLHYQIKSSLITDEVLNIGLSQANQSNASGLITPLTVGTGTLMAIGASVGLQELNGNLISISPNPTNGSLTINSKTELQKIEVLSVDGKVLLSEIPTNVSHTLHIENFANGIYFVNLYQNNRTVKREKVVLNK